MFFIFTTIQMKIEHIKINTERHFIRQVYNATFLLNVR